MSTAQSLETALNTLDTDALTASDLTAFYVKRTRLKTAQMINALRLTDDSKKFLFIGHRGGGKSTELQHLAVDLADQFNIIFVPVYSVFQSGEITHEELIFAIFSRLADVSVSKGWLNKGLLPEIREAFLDKITTSVQRWIFGPKVAASPGSVDTSLGLELGGWGVKLEQKIALDGSARKGLIGKAGEFLGLIDEFLGHIKASTGRRTLLIVEDLDKFDVDATKTLFFDHSQTLLRPAAHVIYTFPVAMRFDDRFHVIEQSFKAYNLPNIATFHRDGTPDDEGRLILREILTRRAAVDLFDPGVIDYLVLQSGVVRDLIRLAHTAINTASAEKRSTVSLADAKEAFAEAMRLRQGMLEPGDYPLLEQLRGKPVAKTPDIQRLLFNGSLLEYQNTTGDWCAPSPDASALLASPERPAILPKL